MRRRRQRREGSRRHVAARHGTATATRQTLPKLISRIGHSAKTRVARRGELRCGECGEKLQMEWGLVQRWKIGKPILLDSPGEPWNV